MIRRAQRVLTLASLALTVLLALGLFFAAVVAADVPTTVDVYQGAGKATVVHLIGGSTAFPNFNSGNTQGAIDNRYPMATVSQDSSPSSQAAGSPADYGPLVAFQLTSGPPQPCDEIPAGTPISNPNCPLPKVPYPPHQPPPNYYALAQYPNPPGKPDASFSLLTSLQNNAPDQAGPCTPGAGATLDCSVVKARELSADALSSYTGGLNTPIQGATADSHTVVTPDGAILTTAHSHLAYINFGGGQLVIRNLDVMTTVKSLAGLAVPKATITIGSITANGQPLTLTDQGTTIPPPVTPPPPPNPIPGVPNGGNVVVPPPGLAGTVAGEIIQVASLKPVLTKDGPTGTVLAQGVSVRVTTPSIPGYPSNFVQYILGEGFVQSYGVPAQPFNADVSATDNTANLGDTGGTPAYSVSVGGDGYTGTAPSNLSKGGQAARRGAAALVSAFRRPPIAGLFLLWELMVMAAAISLVMARRQQPEEGVG